MPIRFSNFCSGHTSTVFKVDLSTNVIFFFKKHIPVYLPFEGFFPKVDRKGLVLALWHTQYPNLETLSSSVDFSFQKYVIRKIKTHRKCSLLS